MTKTFLAASKAVNRFLSWVCYWICGLSFTHITCTYTHRRYITTVAFRPRCKGTFRERKRENYFTSFSTLTHTLTFFLSLWKTGTWLLAAINRRRDWLTFQSKESKKEAFFLFSFSLTFKWTEEQIYRKKARSSLQLPYVGKTVLIITRKARFRAKWRLILPFSLL